MNKQKRNVRESLRMPLLGKRRNGILAAEHCFLLWKEINMQFVFKTLTLLSIALCSTAAAFAADHWRIEVPFDFSAQGQSYRSGAYDVTLNLGYNIIVMSNDTGSTAQITSSIIPTDATHAPVVVRFDKLGTNYILRNIQVQQWVTPNMDGNNKHQLSAPISMGSH
jgi:hypothetical protein